MTTAAYALAATPAYVTPGLINWQDWYPLDRGLAVGRRAINPWSDGVAGGVTYLAGQSTMKLPAGSIVLPSTFGGSTVEYFLNWICGKNTISNPAAPTQSDCRIQKAAPFFAGTYYEYMSQGTASGDAGQLEHWIRGFHGGTYHETYFNPAMLGGVNCSKEDLVAANRISPLHLEDPAKKLPLRLALRDSPTNNAGVFEGPVVCAVVFSSTDFSDASSVNILPGYTGYWFVNTQNQAMGTDTNWNEWIQALNEYWVSDSYWQAHWAAKCANASTFDPYFCTRDAHGQGLTRSHVRDGRTYWIRDAEQYYMRKVVTGNRLSNGLSGYRIDPTSTTHMTIVDKPDPWLGYQRWFDTAY